MKKQYHYISGLTKRENHFTLLTELGVSDTCLPNVINVVILISLLICLDFARRLFEYKPEVACIRQRSQV